MLEIVALVILWKEMGAMLRKKGRRPLIMQLAVVVGWLGSMIVASILYRIYLLHAKGPEALANIGFAVYPWMLLAAILMQGLLFGIAHLLPRRESEAVVKILADYSKRPN